MARVRRRTPPSALPPARQAALKALTSCLRGADIQAALDQALQAPNSRSLDPRDAALATELAYGTLRLKSRLDWLLSLHLANPGGLPEAMRIALAVAAYEITRLDRIPAYASVDWCVDHVKSAINPRLAKVANAVLRRVSELGEAADSPQTYAADTPTDDVFLARFHAAPLWLVRLWLAAYGRETAEAYLRASTSAPPLGLRIRPATVDASDQLRVLTESEQCILSTDSGAALRQPPDNLSELLDSGIALRQSLAGQQALQALNVDQWRGPVWDCCAGRGGKSLLLSDLGCGPVMASDPSKARLKGLAREIKRLGVGDVLPVRARADRDTPLSAPVPSILVDAPCSGLGVLARRPDSKLKRSLEDIQGLTTLQARILDNTARSLAPGGTLAYVTCTLNPDENELQIQSFLNRHPGFTLHTEFQTPPKSPLNEFFYAARLTAP